MSIQEKRTEVERAKAALAEAERRLESAKDSLTMAENQCSHDWSKPIYDPIYHPGYTTPGDPEGTMGVDWRGPCHVPSETIKRWRRTCKKCGKTEETKNIQTREVEEPNFGGR